jgi:hypothetical protein
VGEDPDAASLPVGGARGSVRSMQSGSGLELAKSWETAIRQARLPIDLGESAAADAGTAAVQVAVEDLKPSGMFGISKAFFIVIIFLYLQVLKCEILLEWLRVEI